MCDQFDATHLHVQGRLQEALALHLRILARSADVARRPTDLYICHNARAITRKLLGQHDYMLLDFYEALNAAKACESPGPHINALTNLGGSHTDLWNLARGAEAVGGGARPGRGRRRLDGVRRGRVQPRPDLRRPGPVRARARRCWNASAATSTACRRACSPTTRR